MGVPDGVLAQLAQIQPVAEPQGGGVHARLVAQRLDFLTERNGALGAVGDAQAIGTAIGAAGSLGIKVDGVIQLAAVQDIPAALGFLPCLVLVDGLAEEVDAHFQARVPGVGEMLLEHRVQHQCAGAVAAVADADDDELHACLFGLFKINVGLVFGDINAELCALLHTIGIKIIELVVNGLDARDRLVGVLVIIIGLAVHGPPAGVDRGRGVILFFAKQPLPQPAQQAVLVGQTLGVDAVFIQRAGIQRGPDLLRRQQNGAVFIFDLGLGQRVFHRVDPGGAHGRVRSPIHGGILHPGAQGVFRSQFIGLLLEDGERVLLFQPGAIARHGVCGSGLLRRLTGRGLGRCRLAHAGRCGSSFFFHRSCRALGFGLCGLLRCSFALRFDRGLFLLLFFLVLMGAGLGGVVLPLDGGGLHGQAHRLGCQQGRSAHAAHSNRKRHDHGCHGLARAAPRAFLCRV